MNYFFKTFWVFFKKEWILFFRIPENFLSLTLFCFLVVLIIQLGIDSTLVVDSSKLLSLVWLVTLLAGIIRMNRSFEAENEGHIFDVLRLLPAAKIPFYLSHFVFNFLYLFFVEALSCLLIILLFNINPSSELLGALPHLFVLGAFGFASVGTTFSGMVVSHQRRDLILPIIGYPILAPLIIAIFKCLTFSASGNFVEINVFWLKLVYAFDVIYFVASVMVYEYLLES